MTKLPPLPPLPRKSRARRRAGGGETSSGPVTTYSVRLTDNERRTLEAALEVTGWTASYFITRATLERAAHLLNTRTPRSFDFDKRARRLALQLCDPVFKGYRDDGTEFGEELELSRVLPEGVSPFTDPPSLREDDVNELTRAWRDGGAEFFGKIIDECRRLVVNRAELPEPIDPTKV